MTVAQRVTLDTLEALDGSGCARIERWAHALRVATGAARCELLRYDGDGEPTVAGRAGEDGGPEDRFVGLARPLARGGAPFAARGEGDGLEALGLPLTLDADAPVGSLFLSWKERGAPELSSALEAVAPLAGLALSRAAEREALAEARAALAAAQEALEAQAHAHRDEITALRDQLDISRSEAALRYDYGAIVHASAAFRRVLRMLDRVTDTDLPVLIQGESGVGKELLARALHYNGPRHRQAFVVENCGAIPADLVESTFFGHVRGAFTGAHSARRGLLEQADGGTLFLDEVGELPLEHQVKLLRALQERRFRPVGAQREQATDFRLVAATNRDLAEMVREGRFREDLYYRIAVVTVPVPPLRERPEDILPLVERFLDAHADRTGERLTLSKAAARALLSHGWPGNVRELDNEVTRAAVLCEGATIEPAHLSPRVAAEASRGSRAAAAAGRFWLDEDDTLGDVLGRVERAVLLEALAETKGKKAPAARRLGLSRPGLDGKIARHEIDVAALKGDGRGGGER